MAYNLKSRGTFKPIHYVKQIIFISGHLIDSYGDAILVLGTSRTTTSNAGKAFCKANGGSPGQEAGKGIATY